MSEIFVWVGQWPPGPWLATGLSKGQKLTELNIFEREPYSQEYTGNLFSNKNNGIVLKKMQKIGI